MMRTKDDTNWQRYNELFRTIYETCESATLRKKSLIAYHSLLQMGKKEEELLLDLPKDNTFPFKEEEKSKITGLLLPIRSGYNKNFNWPMKYGILATVLLWALVTWFKFTSEGGRGIHTNPQAEFGLIFLLLIYFGFLGFIWVHRIRQAHKAINEIYPIARRLYYFSEKKLIDSHPK